MLMYINGKFAELNKSINQSKPLSLKFLKFSEFENGTCVATFDFSVRRSSHSHKNS